MSDSKEIEEKMAKLMKDLTENVNNPDQHIEKIQAYIDGLHHSTRDPIDRAGLPMLKMMFFLLQLILKSTSIQNAKTHEIEKNINNLMAKVIDIEKNLAEMRKGV